MFKADENMKRISSVRRRHADQIDELERKADEKRVVLECRDLPERPIMLRSRQNSAVNL